MPFTEAIRLWYEDKISDFEHPIDEVTKQGYDTLMKNHVYPYFREKGFRLCEITKDNLQEFISEKAKNGKLNGKGGLAPRSLKLIKNIVNQTLQFCVAEGMIPSNPCQFVKLPACQRKVTTVVAKDKTKNNSSRRSFPMTPDIKQLLLELQTQQEKDKKFFGKEYHDCDYVFRWPDGRPFSPDYVSDKFPRLLKANNMPKIRFHELRHSAASNLLSMGFSLKDVQEWLGHSDIKTTANIYGHLDAKRKKSMAEALSG